MAKKKIDFEAEFDKQQAAGVDIADPACKEKGRTEAEAGSSGSETGAEAGSGSGQAGGLCSGSSCREKK